MAAQVGRSVTLTWGGGTILGIREKGVKVNGEPIDETTGENSGWRSLLTTPGENTVDVTISGLTKDKVFKTDFFAGNRQKAMVITLVDGSIISGTFMIVSYEDSMPYKDAVAFTAEFQSVGIITYTP